MPFYLLIFSIFFFSACSPVPDTPLKNTYWSLVELQGENISNVSHQPKIHLLFHLNDKSLHGSDGCNSIQASYTDDEKGFSIGSVISTRMQCEEGIDQARMFLEALSKTDRMEIYEDQLIFYSSDIEIARFEAKEDF